MMVAVVAGHVMRVFAFVRANFRRGGMEDEAQVTQQKAAVVADEELRLLEAMAAVSRGMQQMNQVLSTLNRQTVELSQELATAERQMNALYLPFQAAIYEMQSTSGNSSTATATTPAAARYAD